MARSRLAKIKWQPKFWLRALLGLGLAVGLAIVWQHFNLQALLQAVLLWVKHLGFTGILAFIVVYNLATIFFVPASLLTLGGGAIYGVIWGSVYVLIAATLGAVLAFLIGRHCARNWVYRRIQGYPQFRAIDTAVAREGFKIVLLTRLSPLFPFNLLNYAFGVTCVSLKDYAIGSLGMIPGTVLYVYFGALIGDIAALGTPQPLNPQAQLLQWLMKLVGLLATIAVTVYITRIAKRSFTQSVTAASSYDSLH
jgi:uncharacterized membrane protein YdjX (TVP38/TMEM64 family)